mmetsp:Transcript_21005/g.29405  ORF Transcript_21005/g.29405 Transcript_21005/m.29405 type:complete len:96 (-) Transcript_21005:154-441(-)
MRSAVDLTNEVLEKKNMKYPGYTNMTKHMRHTDSNLLLRVSNSCKIPSTHTIAWKSALPSKSTSIAMDSILFQSQGFCLQTKISANRRILVLQAL